MLEACGRIEIEGCDTIPKLFWHQVITPAHTLAWSCFRRHHQAVAQACHYQRRLAPNTS